MVFYWLFSKMSKTSSDAVCFYFVFSSSQLFFVLFAFTCCVKFSHFATFYEGSICVCRFYAKFQSRCQLFFLLCRLLVYSLQLASRSHFLFTCALTLQRNVTAFSTHCLHFFTYFVYEYICYGCSMLDMCRSVLFNQLMT